MARRESVQFAAQRLGGLADWLQQRKRAETAKGFTERELSLQERRGALEELLSKGQERRAVRGEVRKGKEGRREEERFGRETEAYQRGGMTPEQLLQGQGGSLLESMGGLGGIPLRDTASMAGVAGLASTLQGQREEQAAITRGQAPLGGELGSLLGVPGGTTYEQLGGMGGAGPFMGFQGRKAGIEAAAATGAGGQAPVWGPSDALRWQTNYRQAVETYLPIAFSTMRSANPELDERVRRLQDNPMVSPEIEDYLSLLSPEELQEVMRMSSDFAQMSFEQGVGAGATYGAGPMGAPPPGGGGPVEGVGTGMPPEFAPTAPEMTMQDILGLKQQTVRDSLSREYGASPILQGQAPTSLPGQESGMTFSDWASERIAIAQLMRSPVPTFEELAAEWEAAGGREEMISGERATQRKKTPGGGGGVSGGGGGAG